jgi:4-hydroxyphenylpyruvate dioxygenase
LGGFYERVFNFRRSAISTSKGSRPLALRAMTAPDDKIRIPLNESQDDLQPDRGVPEGI